MPPHQWEGMEQAMAWREASKAWTMAAVGGMSVGMPVMVWATGAAIVGNILV